MKLSMLRAISAPNSLINITIFDHHANELWLFQIFLDSVGYQQYFQTSGNILFVCLNIMYVSKSNTDEVFLWLVQSSPQWKPTALSSSDSVTPHFHFINDLFDVNAPIMEIVYIILQVCLFPWYSYVGHTYNFYLFPRSCSDVDARFSCQVGK